MYSDLNVEKLNFRYRVIKNVTTIKIDNLSEMQTDNRKQNEAELRGNTEEQEPMLGKCKLI